MSDEELAKKLLEFADYLHESTMITDVFRWLAWAFVRGMAAIIDGLETVTNDVLLIKVFFQNEDVLNFLLTIRPLLWGLFAISLVCAGYLMIFQRKISAEIVAVNILFSVAVLTALTSTMTQVNDITDDAIAFTKNGTAQTISNENGQTAIANSDTQANLYGNSSMSDSIIKRNVIDLVMFDKANWSTTELEQKNSFEEKKARYLDAEQKFDADKLEDIDIELSKDGKDISEHYLALGIENEAAVKFDQSGLKYNNEYYYRYHVDWLTILTTFAVVAFTLFSIAYKIARLSFELAFNHILAMLVAPADLHDGQKTKKILQEILQAFIVITLVFVAMKLYLFGTAFLADRLEGMAYLIALIAFSVAVVDGPNIVERMFGIDAGLKSGWGVVATTYAAVKVASSTVSKTSSHVSEVTKKRANKKETESLHQKKKTEEKKE